MSGRPAGERGSVSIVAATAMLVAGVLALATVDVTRVLEARAVAQTAADAAALAAAQSLAVPVGPAPSDEASEYAAANGAALRSCSCDPGGADVVVEVVVVVPLVLLGGTRTLIGRARAVVAGPAVPGQTVPAPGPGPPPGREVAA